MNKLHVVRRAFKAGGIFYPAGQIIEDVTSVKLHKIRINDRILVPIPSDKEALQELCRYFQQRVGINLAEILDARVSKGSGSADTEKQVASDKPTPTGTKALTSSASAPQREVQIPEQVQKISEEPSKLSESSEPLEVSSITSESSKPGIGSAEPEIGSSKEGDVDDVVL